MKRYNILNNSLGWFCFLVAAVTYLLTLEPTASFWDCPEFILQGYKLEVGHPPGNPIFMLTARFFANFAFGDVTKVAWMVNAMSGLLSAGTILLLFWTITHLVKKLVVKDTAEEISPMKMIVIFGSGICGALMYAWSDTFWFSAVEGEVYAFSSFCTALVFWLILKWENRADRPNSDKYLILIAYVIGISIAVHLLNLLCIPAIVLVIYYKRTVKSTAKGSIIALFVSFVIVALILYGLVPGFIEVSQMFEMFCVNTLHMSFNTGVLIYTLVTVASFVWTLYNLYHYRTVSKTLVKLSFTLSILLSGILFIGDSYIVPILLFAGLCFYLIKIKNAVPIRVFTLITMGIMVIFAGYSSYALLLIRSSAHTPMNQNAPDNVFALASYLNREQYGDRPLFYGETVNFYQDENGDLRSRNSNILIFKGYDKYGDPSYEVKQSEGKAEYARQIKKTPDEPDRYYKTGNKTDVETAPELKMLFPRMYDNRYLNSYNTWIGNSKTHPMEGTPVDASIVEDESGEVIQTVPMNKATFADNMKYFFGYQLNHMYWRYFLWNFAGRQNDIQGQGEPTHGNWLSGISALDNLRLGDQSLLPDELGKDNPGHNVFFMIPLIMGLIGLFWQASCAKRGIEQFWVVFFLFFMTGIAIVLYLNQTPEQPRERDYAFAGSFYAYAIWVGMGVAGLWHYMRTVMHKRTKEEPKVDDSADPDQKSDDYKRAFITACIAGVVGIIVPLQVVSQTWDDHDRSGRYTARDFGMNYLNSLDENAIIFTYGDNDTFPLWYAQEVEGVRTDVKVVNLSYLTTDWYINQLRRQSYEAPGIQIQADENIYGYNKNPFFSLMGTTDEQTEATKALAATYALKDFDSDYYNAYRFVYPNLRISGNTEAAVKAGRIGKLSAGDELSDIEINLKRQGGGVGINSVMVVDILNTSAKNGWDRPVYFATTVPTANYIGLEPYFSQTGLAYEIVPVRHADNAGVNTEKMYRNITELWRWGGLDKVKNKGDIYLDETVRRMVSSNRGAIFDLARKLSYEAWEAQVLPDTTMTETDIEQFVDDRLKKVETLFDLQRKNLSETVMDYTLFEYTQIVEIDQILYQVTEDEKYLEHGQRLIETALNRYGQFMRYYESLPPILYNTLSEQDKLIIYYYPALINSYHQLGGDVNKMSESLKKEFNIDISQYFENA